MPVSPYKEWEVYDPPQSWERILSFEEIILLMSEERGKCYLYGQADVPIFEEVWLICNASTHYMLGREGRGPNGCKREFYVQFFSYPAWK